MCGEHGNLYGICSAGRQGVRTREQRPREAVTEWRKQYTVERWREVLRTSFAEESLTERLREATARGRPFGADEFVDELESKTERRLRPMAVGRPKKKEEASGDEQRCVQLRLGNGI